MTWTIEWSDRARRDLRHLDRQMAQRAIAAVERLAEPEIGDVRRLEQIDPPEWRLRVGDWRVRFVFNYGLHTIEVLRVLPPTKACARSPRSPSFGPRPTLAEVEVFR